MVTARKSGQHGNNEFIYKSSFSVREAAFSFGVSMENILQSINSVLWGIPALLLILTVGICFSLRSGFAQLRLFPKAVSQLMNSFQKSDVNGTSGYRALCTALAATVGTGNIAGVAGAIALGGPGVIFWMWVCGILGMITKFAEVTLAIHFRAEEKNGDFVGGPMYMIEKGLPKCFRWLAYLYCFFGVVAAFGVGNATQINAVINSLKATASMFDFEISKLGTYAIGLFIAVLVAVAFWKDNGRIGAWAENLVPFASVIYILLTLCVLVLRFHMIPSAIQSILIGAFCPRAVTCGMIGSMFISLRVGASRGIFTNEAGMGTASIAHAAANVAHPVDQGLMGIIEVFLDTIVICTMTALVILCSGVEIPYGTEPGITLAIRAFSEVIGDWSKAILSILICIFAFATILGGGLYGRKCAQYLFGEWVWRVFTVAQVAGIVLSSVLNTSVVWIFSEIVNGLMAIPNLIALIWLFPVFLSVLKTYPNKKNAYRS